MNSDHRPSTQQDINQSFRDIATRLVAARRSATPLDAFPGEIPTDLATAYAIQDQAIALSGGEVRGWKVGRIPLDLEKGLGIDRLAGPIFRDTIRTIKSGDTTDIAAYDGGFIAIEAEFVAVMAKDAPRDKTTWSTDESEAMIADLCIGIEVASSPIGKINALGPPVVVSDHGNNAGLVVGPVVKNWRTRPLESMHCSSHIGGAKVGDGGAFNLTGGFIRSVQFLLELNARRKIPLRAGDVIATGQTTGIHDIQVGQIGTVDFGDDGVINCRIVNVTPKQQGENLK